MQGGALEFDQHYAGQVSDQNVSRLAEQQGASRTANNDGQDHEQDGQGDGGQNTLNDAVDGARQFAKPSQPTADPDISRERHGSAQGKKEGTHASLAHSSLTLEIKPTKATGMAQKIIMTRVMAHEM